MLLVMWCVAPTLLVQKVQDSPPVTFSFLPSAFVFNLPLSPLQSKATLNLHRHFLDLSPPILRCLAHYHSLIPVII